MARSIVILGSSITALAVARDAYELGLTPLVVDVSHGPAFRSRRARRLVLPREGSPDDRLKGILNVGGEDVFLIATSDTWLGFLMAYRTDIDASFGKVLHASNATLATCLSKSEFASWCVQQRLPAPLFWRVGIEPRPAQMRLPVLLRPAVSAHGWSATGLPKAVEAQSEEELQAWLQRFGQGGAAALVSESLLSQPLTQYSVPFVRVHGRTEVFVARKVRPAANRCAVGSYVELDDNLEVAALAERAVAALGYFGIGEAEILRSESTGKLYLIEVNARPWLQYALAPAAGYDFLGILTERERELVKYVRGRRWIDLQSDLFGAFSSSVGVVRHGELGITKYLASLLRANVYARFDWRDPAPALFGRD